MRSRLPVMLVIACTMIALSVTLWTSYQSRIQGECQAEVNAQFLKSINARAAIGDADREAVRTLFEKLVLNSEKNAELSEKEQEAAGLETVQEYFEEQKRLDRLRDEYPLPKPSNC